MNRYEEKARAYFLSGYNCAQAVFLAFAEESGLDKNITLKIASSFGGGMGRLKEVCGALSGGFMAMGLLQGYYDAEDKDAKAAHYDSVHDVGEAFRAEYKTLLCRELLPGQTDEFKRPCIDYVGCAARLVSEKLNLN
ncbi:MAG: C_GCAxxG_C_C family protein [Papillibacter sp.]|nr:C_GCAxxG_C_C family protein [Papillibacter sp.]